MSTTIKASLKSTAIANGVKKKYTEKKLALPRDLQSMIQIEASEFAAQAVVTFMAF